MQPLSALLMRAMPPQYDQRMQLRKAGAEWTGVVGPVLGGQSAPLDLADGELLLVANTPLVANRLSMMGGDILRILAERYRIEAQKVKVVVGQTPLRQTLSKTPAAHRTWKNSIRVKEEDAREQGRGYLEKSPELTEEVALSLARLRIFFEKRFRGRGA